MHIAHYLLITFLIMANAHFSRGYLILWFTYYGQLTFFYTFIRFGFIGSKNIFYLYHLFTYCGHLIFCAHLSCVLNKSALVGAKLHYLYSFI